MPKLSGLPRWCNDKETSCNAGDTKGEGSDSWVKKIPYRRKGLATCLENQMGRGAWWAIVHGVTKSWIGVSH